MAYRWELGDGAELGEIHRLLFNEFHCTSNVAWVLYDVENDHLEVLPKGGAYLLRRKRIREQVSPK